MDSLKVWQEDIFECIVYGSQWMPRPFKHFYSLVKASGYDLSDEDRRQGITVVLSSSACSSSRASSGQAADGSPPLSACTCTVVCARAKQPAAAAAPPFCVLWAFKTATMSLACIRLPTRC